jgi:hemoglobin-like flavoprotein
MAGDMLLIQGASQLAAWERLYRQVFLLSDGYRDISAIAQLLHKTEDTVRNTIYSLISQGYVTLNTERAMYSMDIKDLHTSLDLIPDTNIFAQHFYQILFRDFPESSTLFQRTNWSRQFSSLMATIAYVVAGIERGENLQPALYKLGATHINKQVNAKDYPKVGASLIATFKFTLGAAFTEKMQNSWVAAFDIISSEMINGAREETVG